MNHTSLPVRRSLCVALLTPWWATAAHAATNSKDDAIKMVNQVVALHKRAGRAATLAAVNQADGPFRKGELYIFAYDTSGVMVAHAVNPKLVGKNMLDVPDPDGKYYRKTIQEIAAAKGTGWVDYMYKNPVTGKNEPKSSYLHKIDDVIYCCGIYL